VLARKIVKTYYGPFILISVSIVVIASQAAAAPAVNEPATTTHTIIKTDVDSLASTTGIDDQNLQAIKDGLSLTAVDPEITNPAEGGVVSGSNLLIKGISTPGSVVDILIEGDAKGFSPLMGKATSDKYGVWSYFLGPELKSGEYSVRVFVKGADQTAIYSKKVSFVVPASKVDLSQNIEIKDGFWEQPLLLVIAAIILSMTFLLSMLIWAIVYYLKGLRKKEQNRQSSRWLDSDSANLDDLSAEQLEQMAAGFSKLYKALSSRQAQRLISKDDIENNKKNKSNDQSVE